MRDSNQALRFGAPPTIARPDRPRQVSHPLFLYPETKELQKATGEVSWLHRVVSEATMVIRPEIDGFIPLRLRVDGPRALFSRPEMRVERTSYDCITPSAARGILEAIHWKPEIIWRIARLRILKPIRFESVRRNEVGSKVPMSKVSAAMKAGSTEGLALYVDEDRQQRAATVLRDVAYIIEAHIDLSPKGRAAGESAKKHVEMFQRRAEKGQCFHQPCLGTREFACDFALFEGEPPDPAELHESLRGERDLGWMPLDIDYANGMTPKFFRPIMRDGVIDVPSLSAPEVRS